MHIRKSAFCQQSFKWFFITPPIKRASVLLAPNISMVLKINHFPFSQLILLTLQNNLVYNKLWNGRYAVP